MSLPNKIRTLPPLVCPSSGRDIAGVEIVGSPRAATSFADCLRKCTICDVGASNTVDAKTATYIYLNPLESIPMDSREGAIEALSKALNEQNRKPKLKKFGFSTSEDAVTWVVFTHLLQPGQLIKGLRRIGVATGAARNNNATLLLWGVPINGGDRGDETRGQLTSCCVSLGEDPKSLSEPDVIIDLGDGGLVFIEVKYRSGNEFKEEDYPGWKKYLGSSTLAWRSDEVKRSGCYELARNWRLLNVLAGNRSATLVNLGPPSLFQGKKGAELERFIAALGTSKRSQFKKVTWSELLGEVLPEAPKWFSEFCDDRGLAT